MPEVQSQAVKSGRSKSELQVSHPVLDSSFLSLISSFALLVITHQALSSAFTNHSFFSSHPRFQHSCLLNLNHGDDADGNHDSVYECLSGLYHAPIQHITDIACILVITMPLTHLMVIVVSIFLHRRICLPAVFTLR